MKDDQILQRLREASWRRKLTNAEAAELRTWLVAHPEAQAEWKDDLRLDEALRGLKPAPVASNFTARVLQAIESDAGVSPLQSPAWKSWLRGHGLLPRAAFAVAVLGLGIMVYQRHQVTTRREVAQSMVALSGMKGVPSVEVLQDYDAIRLLGRTPPPDMELLALDLR